MLLKQPLEATSAHAGTDEYLGGLMYRLSRDKCRNKQRKTMTHAKAGNYYFYHCCDFFFFSFYCYYYYYYFYYYSY